tara:strand:- start:801 stop:2108 length:1308 start_codon:yes stop_codon:yes gene_type:complete
VNINKKTIIYFLTIATILAVTFVSYYIVKKNITAFGIFKFLFSKDQQLSRILKLEEELDKKTTFIENLKLEKRYEYNQAFFPKTQFLSLVFFEKEFDKKISKKLNKKKEKYSIYKISPFFLGTSNGYIYISSRDGHIFRSPIDDINKNEKILLEEIHSNIKKNIIVTDILIEQDTFYIATFEKSKCLVEIFYANIKKIDLEFYLFQKVKMIETCNKFPTGGRLAKLGEEIIFSTDAYEFIGNKKGKEIYEKDHLGAIIGINTINKKKRLISTGHRNPQGLIVYNNVILSTEHGPKGGDEINKIENDKDYGWPEVSNGEPYNFIINNKVYLLKKEHKKNGYAEPIFSFVPSIGISQIINVPDEFSNKWKNSFLVTSLNGGIIEKVIFDKNFSKIISMERLRIEKRMRDIVYSEELNGFLIALENQNGSIGIIIAKN